MYPCQLNFAIFCFTSALGISWQRLNLSNLLVRSVYRSYVYFHVRIVLYYLGIPLSNEDGFSKVKHSYIKSAYYSICDDYVLNADEIWVNRDWLCTTAYANFGDDGKATQRSPPNNLHNG